MSDIVGSAAISFEPTGEAEFAAALESQVLAALQAVSDQLTTIDGQMADLAGSLSDIGSDVGTIDIGVEADTSDAEASIDEIAAAVGSLDQVQIDVGADASDAVASLDEVIAAVAAIDGEGAEVTVTADTSAAVDGLDAVSESAISAQDAVGAVAGELGGLASVGANAFSGPSAALAGFVAVNALVFESATEAEGALQSFEARTGSFADEVRNINVGDLNADLGELAIQLGSSDEEALNAAASLFQVGEAAGIAAPQVTETTDQIAALAARAVALNPEVGSVGSAIEGLTTGLSRGGRFLANYGLSLSAAEINARALADTGKDNVAELELFEKTAAGAAIATEALGGSLDADVAAGAENASIQLRGLKERFGELFEEGGADRRSGIQELGDGLLSLAEAYQEGNEQITNALEGRGGPDDLATALFAEAEAAVAARGAVLGLSDAQIESALAASTNIDGQVSLEGAYSRMSITAGLAADAEAQAAEASGAAADSVDKDAEKMQIAFEEWAAVIQDSAESAAQSLEGIGQNTIDSVGVITGAFEDLNDDGTTSLYEFTTNLETQFQEQAAFLANIRDLQARGATDLALALFEAGDEGRAAAAEAALLNDEQLADREQFVDDMATANGLLAVNFEGTRAQLVTTADRTAKDVEKALAGGDLSGAISDDLLAAELAAAEGGFDVGEAAAEGFESGLLSKREALKIIAKEEAQSVIDTWNTVLRISSPSKVFEDIGQNVVAGFTLGVDSGSAEATQAVDAILADTTPAAEPSGRGASVVIGDVNVVLPPGSDVSDPAAIGAAVSEALLRELETAIGTG